MNFLKTTKDGGPKSTVWAHWLFEIKGFCSIVLLRFEPGSRDAYHNHAFDAISWMLKGWLIEDIYHGRRLRHYRPSFLPIITRRSTFHKVNSVGRSWVLSFRGPWAKTWREADATGERLLTNQRKIIHNA